MAKFFNLLRDILSFSPSLHINEMKVSQHSAETLQTALVSDRQDFTGSTQMTSGTLFLDRRLSVWTMTHEIGHMFGIRHCLWLSCVTQGSNHLEELDRRPLDFCPICLRKLQDSAGFKIAERYKALLHWMEEDQRSISRPDEASVSQSALSCPKPTEAFHASTLWLHRCLDGLEKT